MRMCQLHGGSSQPRNRLHPGSEDGIVLDELAEVERKNLFDVITGFCLQTTVSGSSPTTGQISQEHQRELRASRSQRRASEGNPFVYSSQRDRSQYCRRLCRRASRHVRASPRPRGAMITGAALATRPRARSSPRSRTERAVYRLADTLSRCDARCRPRRSSRRALVWASVF